MRNPVRHLDQDIARARNITIRNCRISNCNVGVRLNGARNVLIDGLYTENVRTPILGNGASSGNTILNLFSKNDARRKKALELDRN